ncbi:MAG TPA: MFS transporter [Pantanalinema sp.]
MPFIYLAIVTSFLNLFLQVALTPVFARGLSTDLGLVALAVSAYSIANLVGNLFAGLVVDRFDKVAVLVAGLLAGAAALGLCGTATGIAPLVVLLMLNGLAFSVVTPAAYALLSLHLPDEKRAQGMARSGVTIGLSAMIGPPVAGGLSDLLGHAGAYGAIGGFLVLMGVVLAFGLRGTASGAGDQDVGLRDLVEILGDRRLLPAYLGAFILMYMNGGLVFALPPHLKAMGYRGAMTGALFSTFAVMAIAVFVSPLGNLSRRLGAMRAMAVGAVLLGLGCGLLAFVDRLPLMVAAMAVYGLGFGLVFPAALAALVASSPEGKRGSAFGVFYALFSLGGIAGPFALSRAAGLGVSPFLLATLVPAIAAFGLWSWGARRSLPATA